MLENVNGNGVNFWMFIYQALEFELQVIGQLNRSLEKGKSLHIISLGIHSVS